MFYSAFVACTQDLQTFSCKNCAKIILIQVSWQEAKCPSSMWKRFLKNSPQAAIRSKSKRVRRALHCHCIWRSIVWHLQQPLLLTLDLWCNRLPNHLMLPKSICSHMQNIDNMQNMKICSNMTNMNSAHIYAKYMQNICKIYAKYMQSIDTTSYFR